MRIGTMAFIFLAMISLSACADTNVLEKLALNIVVGFDKEDGDNIRATSVLLKIDPNAREKTQVVASSSMTSKGTRISSNRELSKSLVGGQIRVVMYGYKLAQEGILSLTDTLSRDATLGHMIYLCVSDSNADYLLTHRYPEFSNAGIYLYEMIKQNTEDGEFPSSTIHDFLRDYYSIGKDPAIPLLRRNGNQLMLKGLAMFRDDKFVSEATPRESFLLKLLMNQNKPGSYEMMIDSETLAPFLNNKKRPLKIAIEIAGNKSKIKLKDKETQSFTANVSIRTDLLEISSHYAFDKPGSVQALEQAIGNVLDSALKSFIAKTQAVQADVVGFGEVYRSSVRHANLTKEQWHVMFQDANIQVKTKVKLIRTGVIE